MSKSKGRKLAEWLRDLNSNSKASTASIADDAVTNPKIADGAIHTANLADANVTFAKLHTAVTVTSSTGISASNDNDTTLPTTAALIDYVGAQIQTKDNSDEITEGSTNLYFTNERVDDRVNSLLTAGTGITLTYDDTANTLTVAGAAQYGDSDVASYLSTNGYGTSSSIIASITDSAPTTLDTLNELAAALGDDANFSTTVTNSIATKWTQDNTKISNWDTAYSWGNHASAGYSTFSGSYNDLSNKPTIPTNNNQLTNGAGYITSFDITTQTDSKYLRSDTEDTSSGSLIIAEDWGSGTYDSAFVIQGTYPSWETRGNSTQNYGWLHHQDISGNYTLYSIAGYTGTNWTQRFTFLKDGTFRNGGTGGYIYWHAGNDGSGSGLDADTVDGIQGASFLRSDASDTVAAGVTYSWTATNTAGLVFTNTSYAKSLHIGGWSASNSAGISRIRNSNDNLHLDSGANGHIYLNHYCTGNVYIRGQTAWHAGNDGSGSGLDADTLDGIQGSSLMRLDASQTVPDGVRHTYECYGNIATTAAYQSSLEIFNSGVGTDAFLTFHVGGDYAAYLGLDGGINDLAYGGWSAGAASHRVWHAGNDGAGSGLDADTVDGHNTTQAGGAGSIAVFNASNGYLYTNNWVYLGGGETGIYSGLNGAHWYPNAGSTYGTWRMNGSRNSYGGFYCSYSAVNTGMHDSAGNGGTYRQANGRWYWYHHVGNNCTGFSASTTSSAYSIYSTGAIYSTGNITAYSDRRVKENIIQIDSALDKVNKLEGVYYNKIDDETKTKEIGFIAQDVQEVVPELVTYAEDVDEYGVKYGNATALLVEAVKELTQQVNTLKKELEELKNA